MSEHLGEALSAYLDDELAPAARRETQLHLDRCLHCRVELEDVADARAAVRSLPIHPWPVLPWPELLSPAWAGGRRRWLWGTAAAAAAVVATLLPQQPQVAPALPAFLDSHATRASVTGDPFSQLAPIAVPAGFDR
jgi:anti-sigma factor RsiW